MITLILQHYCTIVELREQVRNFPRDASCRRPRQQRQPAGLKQSERLGTLQHSSGEKLFDCRLGSARLGSHTLQKLHNFSRLLFVCLLSFLSSSSSCPHNQLGVTRFSSVWPGSARCDPVHEQQMGRLRAAGSSYSPAALRASCSSRRGALPPGRTGRRGPEGERSRCTGRGWFMAAAHGSDLRMDSWWALRGDGRARECEGWGGVGVQSAVGADILGKLKLRCGPTGTHRWRF